MKSFIKSFILEYWSMFVVWLVMMVGIALLMSSCSFTRGFNTGYAFTTKDKKYEGYTNPNGVIEVIRLSDHRHFSGRFPTLPLEIQLSLAASNRTQMAGR